MANLNLSSTKFSQPLYNQLHTALYRVVQINLTLLKVTFLRSERIIMNLFENNLQTDILGGCGERGIKINNQNNTEVVVF